MNTVDIIVALSAGLGSLSGAGIVLYFMRKWVERLGADVEHVKKVQEKTASDIMHLRIEFKDCVTWDEFNHVIEPMKEKINEQDKRFAGHVAACQERHGGMGKQ